MTASDLWWGGFGQVVCLSAERNLSNHVIVLSAKGSEPKVLMTITTSETF